MKYLKALPFFLLYITCAFKATAVVLDVAETELTVDFLIIKLLIAVANLVKNALP